MYRREIHQGICVGGAVAIGLSSAGCLGIGSSGAASSDVDGTLVEMTDDNRFDPDRVTIPAGERVVWRTVRYAPHTVTAYKEELPPEAEYFASGNFMNEAAARRGASEGDGVLYQGEEYRHTFEVPGEYGYFCIPHEEAGMTGTIIVEPSAESGQGAHRTNDH
jgi:plastocyanin